MPTSHFTHIIKGDVSGGVGYHPALLKRYVKCSSFPTKCSTRDVWVGGRGDLLCEHRQLLIFCRKSIMKPCILSIVFTMSFSWGNFNPLKCKIDKYIKSRKSQSRSFTDLENVLRLQSHNINRFVCLFVTVCFCFFVCVCFFFLWEYNDCTLFWH